MAINWYPGHMVKARRKVKEILHRVDAIIEVLDARLPQSSTNPMIEKLRGEKPYFKVMSKSDLADPITTKAWQDFFRAQRNMDALAITTHKKELALSIPDRIRKLVPNRGTSAKPIRAMILGIPNVGKSTLINTLAGKKIANVGDEPAVTKAQQKVTLSDEIYLVDTPGMLWPGLTDVMYNYRLAASGAIKDTAFDYDDVAMFAMDYMLQRYPGLLQERFHAEEWPDNAYDALEIVASKRGCMRRNGFDLTRTGDIFIKELRAGKLGRISFEQPDKEFSYRDLEMYP